MIDHSTCDHAHDYCEVVAMDETTYGEYVAYAKRMQDAKETFDELLNKGD